jgi:tetrahydromethanopterin S-methyltransferase subunit H
MKDGLLLGWHVQFFVISIAPNLLHVVPVSDDAMLDWILEVEDTPLCLCFISSTSVSVRTSNGIKNAPDEGVLGVHADRVLLVAETTDDGSAERISERVL